MKELLIGLVLTYTLSIASHTSFASSINPSVPIGMSEQDFSELLTITKEIVRDSEAIDSNQDIVVAFYGSRTHFNYGYGPKETSDLDVMFIFEKELDAFEMLDFQEEIANVRLSEVGEKVNFQISQEIPMTRTLDDVLSSNDRSFLNYISPEREAELLKESDLLPTREEQKLYYVSNGGGGINKEAILMVIPKEDESADQILERLQELGYKNIIQDKSTLKLDSSCLEAVSAFSKWCK